MLLLSLLCCTGLMTLVSTVSGEPSRCCFDKEYSVDLGVVGEALTDDPDSAFFIDGTIRMGFDYYRDRQGLVMNFRQPDGSMVTSYQLKDYATRRVYAKEGNKTCTYSNLLDYDVMRPPCIPNEATFVGSSQFGYGHNSLKVNTWRFTYPLSANNDSGLILTVTQDHCVPITESIIGEIDGFPIEESLFFVNYHPGIENLQNLEPPTNCQPASTSTGRRK